MASVWILVGIDQYDGRENPVIAVFDHNPEQGECKLALDEYLQRNSKPDSLDVQEFDLRTAPIAPAPVIDREARTAERAHFVSDTCNALIKAGKLACAVTLLRSALHVDPKLAYTPEFSALASGPLGAFIEGRPDDVFCIPVDSPEFRAEVSATLRELYPEAAAELDRFNLGVR